MLVNVNDWSGNGQKRAKTLECTCMGDKMNKDTKKLLFRKGISTKRRRTSYKYAENVTVRCRNVQKRADCGCDHVSC